MNNTSNLNTSFVNMSRDELENEIINLKSINTAQSQKIEDDEQKLYDLKRLLSTAKAMEDHLSVEIDFLQKTDKSECNELSKKISALEDEIHTLKQSNTETVQYYEIQLQKKNSEIENIIESMKAKPEFAIEIDKDEINKCTDEICDLKLKIDELSGQLLDCETKYQEVSIKNTSLEIQITELSSQLNEFRNCLEVKKEELEESKELARNLQDDMIVMQMEIDKFKSLPMENAVKGNSLFAEVDDNRVKLQKTMETMKRKYMDMRTQYTSKCLELQKLHMEYAALIKVIENKNDSSDEKSDLMQTYERHFDRLNENIKSLENELALQKNACTKVFSKDWKYTQEMVAVTRHEVQALQNILNTESLGLITSESNHYKTKRDLKKWQAEAMQLRAQILSLNQTIEELKLLNSPPVTVPEEVNVLKKSCLKNSQIPLLSEIGDWELTEEKFMDYSILNPKLNDDVKRNDLNITQNFADCSIFESNALKINESNEECNKENDSEDKNKIQNITLNDTMDTLTANLRKVSFEENTEEPQRTGKLGGRKIINAKPIHIPSIKRN